MFDAVLATRPASPLDFDARLRALVEFLRLPEAQALAAANKRIANILRKATEPVGDRVDADRLVDPGRADPRRAGRGDRAPGGAEVRARASTPRR